MSPPQDIGDQALIGAAGGAGNGGFDDESLKAYWKFNEVSGSIINVSEASVDLGTAADIIMTGGDYEETGTPADLGTAVLFDGSSDKGEQGTSLSQWDYKHGSGLTDAEFTTAWWMKVNADPNNKCFFGNAISESHVGWLIWCNDAYGPLSLMTSNGSTGRPIAAFSPSGYIPDYTNWHFYVITCNMPLANSNVIFMRDNNNEEIFSKIVANVPSDANATQSSKVAVNPSGTGDNANMYICEVSDWSKIMSSDDQTSLWNDGDGLEIY